MVYNTNIIAIVGDGTSPEFPEDRVVFWNDQTQQRVGVLDCPAVPTAIVIREDLFAVGTADATYVYDFASLALREHLDVGVTGPALLTAPASRSAQPRFALPHPSAEKGYASVYDFADTPLKHTPISAHEHGLAAVAFSADGSLVATASARGTLIRVFLASNGRQVSVYRRGSDSASIVSLAFAADGRALAAAALGGSVWVFDSSAAHDAGSSDNAAASGRTLGWRQRLRTRPESPFLRINLGGRNTSVTLSPAPDGSDIYAACSTGELFLISLSGGPTGAHALTRQGKFL